MRQVTILMLLALLLCTTCGDDRLTRSDPPTETAWDLTPLEDETAELMALWLSDELAAPMDLYHQIKRDLDTIKSQLGDSLEVWDDSCDAEAGLGGDPSWEIGFRPVWSPSALSVNLHDTIWEPVVSGEHVAWNELIDSLRVDSVVPWLVDHPGLRFLQVYFAGRVNTPRLTESFEDIPGVINAYSGGWAGDWPVILPYRDGDDIRYFYRFAWGDCPSGCIYSHVYYIAVEGDSAVVRGDYGPPYPEPWPTWVDSFRPLMNKWRKGAPW